MRQEDNISGKMKEISIFLEIPINNTYGGVLIIVKHIMTIKDEIPNKIKHFY